MKESPRRPAEPTGTGGLLPLSAILGQEPVMEMLRQALLTGKLHHALLFVGPEGVGKRTTALALAARLLCRSPAGTDACGRCPACAQVWAGSHPDLRREGFFFSEKRKEPSESMVIEQMRALQSFFGGRALAGGRKIALLEEAHALTEEAQNALLKTLEEPPAASLVILVCHNASKLQLTVRSRCQRVAFSPLVPAVIERILGERLELPEEEARFLADHSSGSLEFAANATLFRETQEHVAALLARAGDSSFTAAAAAAKELLSTARGVPLELKVLLRLLRLRMRAEAGFSDGPQLTRSGKKGRLEDALGAVEAAYGAVVDIGRNANRRLATERMWLRITESMTGHGRDPLA